MKRLANILISLTIAALSLSSCNKVKVEDIPANLQLTDDHYQIDQGESLEIDFLANDFIVGEEITVTVKDETLDGNISIIEGSMKYLYTPKDVFYGEDAFSYEICADGSCKTANVAITVDKAIIEVPDSCRSYAIGDNYETDTDHVEAAVTEIISNDVSPCYDWDLSTFTILSEPKYGNVTVINNVFEFSGYPDWEKDEIEYEICNEAGECKKASIKIRNSNILIPTQL